MIFFPFLVNIWICLSIRKKCLRCCHKIFSLVVWCSSVCVVLSYFDLVWIHKSRAAFAERLPYLNLLRLSSKICRLYCFLAFSSQYACFSMQVRIRRHLSHLVEKPKMWFPNRSDTNRPVQLQKQTRSLKF